MSVAWELTSSQIPTQRAAGAVKPPRCRFEPCHGSQRRAASIRSIRVAEHAK